MLIANGHDALDVRDIGMVKAPDAEIAARAMKDRLCLLTEDWGFADIRAYPPERYFGLVIFEVPDNSIDEKVMALRNLVGRPDVVQALPGRLAIVTSKRIRLRPPL